MRYCAYFCEENIWHLCHDAVVTFEGRAVPIEDRWVVFVSNAARSVRMRHQRAGQGSDVCWDYHVVLVVRGGTQWQVWDLDCVLGSPLEASHWFSESFPDEGEVHPPLAPCFRVIQALRFLEVFRSDRSHMLDATGHPVHTLPPWPPIQDSHATSNLMRFVDMTTPFEGEVLGLHDAKQRFMRG